MSNSFRWSGALLIRLVAGELESWDAHGLHKPARRLSALTPQPSTCTDPGRAS